MNNEEINRFNKLFNSASERISKDIYIDGYKYKSLGFFSTRRLRKSIKEFEKCLEMQPDHWQSMFFKAKAHQRLMEHNEAYELFEEAFKIDLESHVIPMEAALEAMHLELIDEAVFYSTESLKRKPDDFVLLGNHAMNLLVAKQDEEAKISIDKAIELNPNDSINMNILNIITNVVAGTAPRPTFKDAIGG